MTNQPLDPPVSLPTFVPSTAAVENAAKALAGDMDPSMTRVAEDGTTGWDNAPAYVKNWYLSKALGYLNAAAGFLVADLFSHAVTHHKAYGLSKANADELIDAHMLARGHAETSHQGALPGLL